MHFFHIISPCTVAKEVVYNDLTPDWARQSITPIISINYLHRGSYSCIIFHAISPCTVAQGVVYNELTPHWARQSVTPIL